MRTSFSGVGRSPVLVGGAVALLIAGLLAAAPAEAGSAERGSTADLVAAAAPSAVTFTVSQRATGLDRPTQVTSARDGVWRLFIVQKTGLVRTYAKGAVAATPYLDLTAKVSTERERGLLGLAFSPNFWSDRRLYVSYTRKGDGALVVSRFTASTPGSASVAASTERVLLTVARPDAAEATHNGGGLDVDPSGLLYISTGDGGGSGDPYGLAQSPNNRTGKVLRIDPTRSCGSLPYCIPATNPYATAGGDRTVLARGFRNPWRISVDPVTRFVYVGDVGQDLWEEVDVITPARFGANYGWSCVEGRSTFAAGRCTGEALVGPTVAYCHPAPTRPACEGVRGGSSITGGLVYRGKAYSGLIGTRYLFGDFISGNLWTLTGGTVQPAGSLPLVTSFGADDAGEPWAVTFSGALVALVPRAS